MAELRKLSQNCNFKDGLSDALRETCMRHALREHTKEATIRKGLGLRKSTG